LGKRKNFRFGEKIAQAVMPVFSKLMLGKAKKYRPIEGDTVAAAMITAGTKAEHGTYVYQYEAINALAKNASTR
jgi:hypothetical protein